VLLCLAGDEDGESIELAFSKKKIEDRKLWLAACVPGTFLDHRAKEISYCDFVNRELILFSRADLDRSIPSMMDGLKPGQRKILYACFKRNLKTDIKVRITYACFKKNLKTDIKVRMYACRG
jgi:DNA topoisomerase II